VENILYKRDGVILLQGDAGSTLVTLLESVTNPADSADSLAPTKSSGEVSS